jgi:hypothetical protein
MIEREGHYYDDSILRPYSLTRRMVQNYKLNECEVICVYGMPEGIGKSAHVNHVLADISGFYKCKDPEKLKWLFTPQSHGRPKEAPIWEPDWEGAKKWIMYPPEEIVDLCMDMLEKGQREVCLHWDDAGTWLNAMEFHDPFVISFMRYLSLARTNWGGLILSTPVEEWVLRKLHTAAGVIHVQVVGAEGSNDLQRFRPRLARAYKILRYPGQYRPYWQKIYEDTYMAIMPDSFYNWYKPKRDGYAKIAVHMMRDALEKRKMQAHAAPTDEVVLKEIERTLAPPENAEKHIGRANDKSKDFTELLTQTFATVPERE